MDVSRLKIKGQIFTIKDPVSRDLANAASEVANKAVADAATAFNAANEAAVSANAANATANNAEDNATLAMDTANAANAKAEQALNRAIPSKVSELTNDAGYVTAAYVGEEISGLNIPTKVSELTNDAGYVTTSYVSNEINGLNLPTQIQIFSTNISIANLIEGTITLHKFGRVCNLLSSIHTIGNISVGVHNVTLASQIPANFLPSQELRSVIIRSDSANDNFGTYIIRTNGTVSYAVNIAGVNGVYLISSATYITKE